MPDIVMDKPLRATTRLTDAMAEAWSERAIENQLDYFGIDAHESFAGKRVLEFGPGKAEILTRHLSSKGADVTAAGPNYQLAFDEEGAPYHPEDINTEHASIRRIPSSFQNFLGRINERGTYDCIYSSFAVPYYLESSDKATFIQGVATLLRPGGIAKFYPISTDEKKFFADIWSRISENHPSLRCTVQKIGTNNFTNYETLIIEKI